MSQVAVAQQFHMQNEILDSSLTSSLSTLMEWEQWMTDKLVDIFPRYIKLLLLL